MTRNTSDKTELTIKYLEKVGSAEPLAADESRELTRLLVELKAANRRKVYRAHPVIVLFLRMLCRWFIVPFMLELVARVFFGG